MSTTLVPEVFLLLEVPRVRTSSEVKPNVRELLGACVVNLTPMYHWVTAIIIGYLDIQFPHVGWDLSNLSVYMFWFPHVKCHICAYMYLFNGKMLADNSNQKMPTKVIKPDNLCRLCRCSPAALGRRKCNLFSSKKLIEEKITEWLSMVLDMPLLKSSIICYKWEQIVCVKGTYN